MRIGFLLLICLLTGCAVQSPVQRAGNSVPDGTWQGALDWMQSGDGSKITPGGKLVVTSCAGQVQVWTMGEDGRYRSKHNYEIRSNIQSHTIQFTNAASQQPDWVEIQTFTLLEIDDKEALIHWTRAVNNRDLPATDPKRAFFEYGTGRLQRIKDKCANPSPQSF